MEFIIETERLYLRELVASDDVGMFELDSDPEVHRFIENKPIQHIEESQEAIRYIQKQYAENGIGRWAVLLKKFKLERYGFQLCHWICGWRCFRFSCCFCRKADQQHTAARGPSPCKTPNKFIPPAAAVQARLPSTPPPTGCRIRSPTGNTPWPC